MPSEALAQLAKLFDKPAVISREQNENLYRGLLGILDEWLDLFLQRLLQAELFVVHD